MTLPRIWAWYSAATGCVVFGVLFAWAAVPYPWVGTAERVLALLLVSGVAAIGCQLTTEPSVPGCARTGRDVVGDHA
jgi:hypothetical protein